MPAHREEPGAALLRCSDAREVLGPFAQDVGKAGQRLHVVDDGWTLEESRNRGEWRLDFRKPFPSLQRGQQGCFLAADVGAGAAMDDHVEVEAAALDVLSKPAIGVRFLHRATEALSRPEVFAPNVHVRLVAADRIGSDDHAFDQRVGVALENVSVLECARFSLVPVDDEILGFRTALGDEGPLSRGWESRAAQTAQVCAGHLVDDLSGCHR